MERVEAPTTATLEAIADAFNRHDVDAIMAFFAEDAVFEAPAGLDPGAADSSGRIRCARGSPPASPASQDVHYGDASHWVSGDRGVSEWTLTGTTTEGARLELRGSDLWTFRDGQVVRKDSYWKIVSA